MSEFDEIKGLLGLQLGRWVGWVGEFVLTERACARACVQEREWTARRKEEKSRGRGEEHPCRERCCSVACTWLVSFRGVPNAATGVCASKVGLVGLCEHFY